LYSIFFGTFCTYVLPDLSILLQNLEKRQVLPLAVFYVRLSARTEPDIAGTESWLNAVQSVRRTVPVPSTSTYDARTINPTGEALTNYIQSLSPASFILRCLKQKLPEKNITWYILKNIFSVCSVYENPFRCYLYALTVDSYCLFIFKYCAVRIVVLILLYLDCSIALPDRR
jgi:hypothetical protein